MRNKSKHKQKRRQAREPQTREIDKDAQHLTGHRRGNSTNSLNLAVVVVVEIDVCEEDDGDGDGASGS